LITKGAKMRLFFIQYYNKSGNQTAIFVNAQSTKDLNILLIFKKITPM